MLYDLKLMLQNTRAFISSSGLMIALMPPMNSPSGEMTGYAMAVPW